jgi:hypothetical protein
VGKGIVTGNGADPLLEWKTRLNWFGSAALSADLRALLSGAEVLSLDGQLEISSLDFADGSGAMTLTIRRPEAPYVADLVVIPLPGGDGPKNRDPRSPTPAPDQWRSQALDGVEWELFNCKLVRLKSREN